MNDLPTEMMLSEIGENLHRCGKRIALPRSQEVEGSVRFLPQFRKQPFENAFRTTRPYKDQVECIASIIGVVATPEQMVNTQTVKKILGDGIDRLARRVVLMSV